MGIILNGLKGIGVLIVVVIICCVYVTLNLSLVIYVGDYFGLHGFDEFMLSIGLTAICLAFAAGTMANSNK